MFMPTLTWLLPLFLYSHFFNISLLNASTSSLFVASRFATVSSSRSRYPRAMDFILFFSMAAARRTRCLLVNLSLRFVAITYAYNTSTRTEGKMSYIWMNWLYFVRNLWHRGLVMCSCHFKDTTHADFSHRYHDWLNLPRYEIENNITLGLKSPLRLSFSIIYC